MTTNETNTTHDLSAVDAWIQKMAERGIYQGTTARLRATAIERLSSVLGTDEPRTVEHVLANIGDLTERWIKRESGNPETAVTYRSRAKVALEDFLAYQANPTGWRPKSRPVSAEGGKKAKEPQLKLVDEETTEESPRATTPTTTTERPLGMDRCLLADGEVFLYRLPSRPLEAKDVLRIAVNLLSQARDFDGESQVQRELITLARGVK